MFELISQLFPMRIEFAALVLTRVLALVSLSPFFGTASPVRGYKIAIGVAMTIILIPVIPAGAAAAPSLGLELIPFVMAEFFAGALLAWIVSGAFAAVRLGGELITTEMGFNLSMMLDPVLGASSPVITTLYQTLAGLIFVSIGAHRWVLAALVESFHTIPVGGFDMGADPASALLPLLMRFLEAGAILAAPVMVAMFVITILLGIISRAVPQLNILDTGYALRAGAAVGTLILLLPAFRVGLDSIFDITRSALAEAPAAFVRP